MRQFWLQIHRYIGLSIVVFLIVAGLTGSVLTFYDEFDSLVNPDLYQIDIPSDNAELIDPLIIREYLLKKYPNVKINWIRLKPQKKHALVISVEPNPDSKQTEDTFNFNEIFVNPYTGYILGTRMRGKISDGMQNIIPFMYELHSNLALSDVGSLLMGIVALLWSFDCFIGAYLTLPRKTKVHIKYSRLNIRNFYKWFHRWQPAWKIRWLAGRYKLNFDLHTALGLWLWLILFVFAWSAVAFNFVVVYKPVMGATFGLYDARSELQKGTKSSHGPKLGYAEAREVANNYLDTCHDCQGIKQIEPTGMSYFANFNVYHYRFRSNRDVSTNWGDTRLYLDGNTGEIKGLTLPTGEVAGNTITTWIKTLHRTEVWGVPYKVLIFFTGIALTILSVSGVIIWKRKSLARRKEYSNLRSL